MFGPAEFKARLLGIRINPKAPLAICDEEELIGCSEEEILEIEQSAGFPLPKAYKDFMRIAGKKSGQFLRDCEIHYPQVIRTNERTKEFMGRFIDLPNPCYFFLNYIGVTELFFSDEGDDPPIYKLDAVNGTDTYNQCAPSFWKCIEALLKDYESR